MERKGERKVNESIVMLSWKKTTFSTCNITCSIGKTEVCKENRKITMKKCGPKHISIPNEKVVGGSFKSRMRREKNISKQQKTQDCVVPFIHSSIRKITNSLTLKANKSGKDTNWVPQQECPNCPRGLVHELPVVQGAIPLITGIIRSVAIASDVNTNVKSQRPLCRTKIH